MKKEKKDKKYLVLIVLLLLFTVSIGYAVLSRNYNFNGLINVKGNAWDITPPDSGDITEEPADPANPPQVEVDPDTGDVTISYTATLEEPGDIYTLTVPIRNNGTIDAVLQTVTQATELTTEQKEYLTYSITAEDGSELQGKDLAVNGEIRVKITVKYRDDNQEKIPTENVTGIQLKTVLNFVQKTN